MEEKNEKKTIKCSYTVLVIILFAALAFITDYIIIDRKTRKCNCPKCEATNNEVISDNTDNTQVTENTKDKIVWNNHYSYSCNKIENDSCFINNGNYEIILSQNDGNEFININNNIFKLENGKQIDNIYLLDDGYVFFTSGNGTEFLLIDRSANIVNDFRQYFDSSYEYNGVSWHDGYIDIYSTIAIHSTSICYHNLGYNSDDIVEKIIRYQYIGNGKLDNPINYKQTKFSEYLKEQSGYDNCNDFLQAHSNEG
jgi:hypothetical protein